MVANIPMHTIVLLAPQIPQNTGNIARLCAVTGTTLHLVGTLGFEITDKHLKRSGLDYWKTVDIAIFPNMEEYVYHLDLADTFLFSTKGTNAYTDVQYTTESIILFGNETSGAPPFVMDSFKNSNHLLRIPQRKEQRCLNLAVSAGIALYEALRQTAFINLV